MTLMLLGAGAMVSFTVSLFFLRFWTTTRDRFFLFFAIAFGLEGINRLMLGWRRACPDEYAIFSYLLTLLAFLIILYAIVDKNLLRKVPKK